MTSANQAYTTTAMLIERNERVALVSTGLPARPVIVPIASVDFEPIDFMERPHGEGGHYRLTMDQAVAKEIGLTV